MLPIEPKTDNRLSEQQINLKYCIICDPSENTHTRSLLLVILM